MSADDLAIGLEKNEETICENCLTEEEFRVLLEGNLDLNLEELGGVKFLRLSNCEDKTCTRCHEKLY